MVKKKLILVINPGSTSTKAACFQEKKLVNSREILHGAEELKNFSSINEQLEFRKEAVLSYLRENGLGPEDLQAIACRGGNVGQLEPGAYEVDQAFVEASFHSETPHPANLSPIIGYEIAKEVNEKLGRTPDSPDALKAYVYDPVCGCGIPEKLYTITGIPEIEKPFLTHVLNSRAVSIEEAKREGKKLEETCYIVAHLGGGITVNLLKGGRILDLVGDDEGGFSPERSGGLSVRLLTKLCYSGRYTEQEMQKRLKGKGGLMAYLGMNDLREVEKKIAQGDKQAALILDAMILQTAKDIVSLGAVTCGKIDKIILTGGMAHSKMLTDKLRERVKFLAPVDVIAGTYEMEALAFGILRVLRGEEKARRLPGQTKKD